MRRLLLDTSSLVYRAFFALPTTISDPRGRPVNAVYGYLDMTSTLLRSRGGRSAGGLSEVVHCLDDDFRPAPRVAAYPGYKAERAADPPELPRQFDVLEEVLDAAGGVRAIAEGWEADDVIGTLCAEAGEHESLDIVTGDRDLIQLVRDGEPGEGPAVRVLYTVKGVKQLAELDERAVRAKYGIPPSRYVDYATIRGDASDGLPGIKGVGEKTARDLIRQYASLDELMADSRHLSPRLRQSLAEAGDYLSTMRRVVPVRSDLPIVFRRGKRDDAALERVAERHGLSGPVRRLREALP